MKRIVFITILCSLLLSTLVFITPSVQAAETVSNLTIQQAVDLALENNSAIQSAELSIESKEDARTTIVNSSGVQYVPTGPTSNELLAKYTNLVSASINWQMSKKTLSMTEDALVYTVISEYTNTISAIESLAYAEESLKNAQVKLNNARIGNQVGVTSNYEMDQIEAQYNSAQAAVITAQTNVNKAYQALNSDLGLNLGDRPVLSEKPEYTSDFKVNNLNEAIAVAVANNPQIWMKDQAVQLAKLQITLYNWSTTHSDSYRSKEISVQQAELSATEAKDQAEQLLWTVYDNIINSEEAYKTNTEALNIAEQALRIAKIKYEIGMATQSDVKEAQLAVNNKKITLDNTIYQHELLIMAFQKPWATSSF